MGSERRLKNVQFQIFFTHSKTNLIKVLRGITYQLNKITKAYPSITFQELYWDFD